jgi:hypothetical protein
MMKTEFETFIHEAGHAVGRILKGTSRDHDRTDESSRVSMFAMRRMAGAAERGSSMKCDLVSRRSLLLGRLFWRGASVYGPSIVNNDRAKWVNGDIAAAVYYPGPNP